MRQDCSEELFRVICSITSVEDCRAFLEDLCTPKELGQMSERLRAAMLLRAGKTYDEIIAETEISSATLSRISKCVKNSSGYNRVLDRDTNEKK